MPRGRDGFVKHAAKGLPIDATRLDAESYNPTGKLIHDDEYPMGLECGGLTAEQVHTPEPILDMTDE